MKKILGIALMATFAGAAMAQTFGPGAGFSIPDNSAVGGSSDITVGAGGTIASLNNVRFTVSTAHTWVGDLIVEFKNVTTNTSVHLMSRLGSTTATGVGSSGDLTAGLFTFVDGSGAAQPLSGNMLPGIYNRKSHALGAAAGNSGIGIAQWNPNTFAAFAGQNLAGTYRLSIWDNATGDTGAISNWDFNVTAVPEPATMAVLGMGAAALLRRRRK